MNPKENYYGAYGYFRGFQVICVAQPGEVVFVPAGWRLDVEGLRVLWFVRVLLGGSWV